MTSQEFFIKMITSTPSWNMANCYLVFVGLLYTATQVASDGYYTVTASKVLRPNTNYDVVVSTQLVSEPATILIGIGRADSDGERFDLTQTVTVDPYTTQIVKFVVSNLQPGTYNLTARGTSGFIFENTTTLEYVHKSFSVFIQTDKAMYKPGQKVLFRAVVVDSYLKPTISSPLDIHISDGQGNILKQWTQVQTKMGVFSGEFQLSDFTVTGIWTITVSVLGETSSKTLEVAEYTLPTFDVTVDSPAHVTYEDSHIVATVHAKYTYGKAVEGIATVTVNSYPGGPWPVFFDRAVAESDSVQPVTQPPPVSKVVPINGDAVVEFDIKKDLGYTREYDYYDRSVQFDVSVTETLTGKVQNTSFEVMLHRYKYKVELVKTSEYFKPGLKYTAIAKVSHQDDTPVQDRNNPLIVKYGFTYDQSLFVEEKHFLNDGLAELYFYPPIDSNGTSLSIQAQYLDVDIAYAYASSATSPSNSFIQAVLVTQNPTVNQDIEFDVNSTDPMKYLSFQVISRGIVILADIIEANDEKTVRLRFVATSAMAPTAHVVVYSLREDGEVVADAVDIELDGTLQNFVNISVNPSEVEPGSNVTVEVESMPNSCVNLLGVDQSVLILKSGNDITEDTVLNELRSYDDPNGGQSWSPLGGFARRSAYWWPDSSTAAQAFENSGAVILTNALVPQNTWDRYPLMFARGELAFEAVALDAAPVLEFAKAGAAAGGSVEPVRVRQNFPETLIWLTFDAGEDGKQSIQEVAADTITSWIISGFFVDSSYGLGVSRTPGKFTVFRPFFVSTDLPYSVIRNEMVGVYVLVFNYMDKDVIADVVLENEQSENYDFVELSGDVNEEANSQGSQRKQVLVKSNSGSPVTFLIVPKKIGPVPIKVTATSNVAGDSLVKNLLVKPEGDTQYGNKAVFVDLKDTNNFNTIITLEIPEDRVKDSERVEVSAIGNVMGQAMANLNNLIRMPSGCGEQNMLLFVPNIVVLGYLKAVNQLTADIETKALQFMEMGYQQELTYRHSDGSFSAFGESDPSGSTWLTAFVCKSFDQAKPYITIDDSIIQVALQWLSSHQAPNGSFPEVGQVIHTDMQGGAGSGLALTSFVLTALLGNAQGNELYGETIKKSLDYIAPNLDGLDDVYALAITCYALTLAQHDSKDLAYDMFEKKAQTSGDMKWWSKPVQQNDDNPWHSQPNSVDVEMSAYGILIYLLRGQVSECLPIMKWLISQQNEQGGFASTQDTVVGLQALAKLAEHFSTDETDLSITFSYSGGSAIPFTVNKDNSLILQKQELPGSVREVDITATGKGFAVLQVSYQFNQDGTGDYPLFSLDVQVDKNSNTNHLLLNICASFIGTEGVTESNMAVIEVSLPSGFTVDSDSLPSLRETPNVKRVETKNGNTVVVIYFNKMTKEQYCVNVSAFRTFKVGKQKPVPVRVYDYYDSSRRATVFYEPPVASVCDICEGDDCVKQCA